ncbi:uncharacterized protein LOC114527687 [Dendronephthya gigantea]|uniref:uncharacterized protein LOC114527687 n=1 Tax=Dendronephthya gigantea TaxID=151771 RepID=UPI00106B1D74|nr:uncharacterized protein LOC114527687 [Dendronephthya gigantea]
MMSELKQACIVSKKKYEDKGPKIISEVKAYRQEQSFQKIREQKGVPHLQFPAGMLLARTFASRARFLGIPSALTSTNQTAEASSTLPDLGPNSSNENGVNDPISQKTNSKNNAEINYEGEDVLLGHCRRYKSFCDQILEEPKELMRVFDDHEKRQSNLDELDRMLLTLDKCINALNRLLKHWKEITNMFYFFHVMLEENLKEDGRRFGVLVVTAEIESQWLIRDYKKNEQIAQQMKRISSLYVKISETYLLDGLIHLQRIDSLEPSTDREKMEEIKKELQDDQRRARSGILALKEMEENCERDLQEIDSSDFHNS